MINDTDLSRAWSRLLLGVLDGAGTEVSPLVLSVTGFGERGAVPETQAVRQALDQLLKRKGRLKVEDVAFTIFPQRLWEMSRGDRARLFALYRATFPRWQAMNKKANGRGLYFERMVMYGRGPCDGNQLEWILSQYGSRAGVRRSMLQATTFDPARDHVASAQLGFPCLQQVSFEPTAAGLVVNAFYATQQIFDKAYGNYLGLAQLGVFMAHEMDMPLARMNVMVGVAKLERITKSDRDFAPLVAAAEALVSGAGLTANADRDPGHGRRSGILRKKLPKPAAKRPRGRPPKSAHRPRDSHAAVRPAGRAAQRRGASFRRADARSSCVISRPPRSRMSMRAIGASPPNAKPSFSDARAARRGRGPAMRCSRPTNSPTPIGPPIGQASI